VVATTPRANIAKARSCFKLWYDGIIIEVGFGGALPVETGHFAAQPPCPLYP
jgi:hypothetical protein